jgi:guanosine-3',5'-bis(diphosphate) 3'-pyrophosphohydrolase
VSDEKLEQVEQAKPSKLKEVTQAVRRALRLGEDRVLVKGVDDVLVYRARCCNPIRGEDVIGYITRGKGVAVHAKRCKNAANLMVNRERVIDVEWAGSDNSTMPYAVRLATTVEDRQGMLAALTNAIASINTNIRDARTDNSTNGSSRVIDLTVDITDIKHLERVISALKGVEGVLDVERGDTQISGTNGGRA